MMRSWLGQWTNGNDPEQLLKLGFVLVGAGLLGLTVWFLVSAVVAIRRELRRRKRRQRL